MLVLASSSKPMVLLGEVHELEVDGERTEDERLAVELETGDGLPQPCTL
jgi:hypothetical protein